MEDVYKLHKSKSSINCLVNGAVINKLLSFLDTYFGYNQIKMDPRDEEKMTFITKFVNFCYKFMPSRLKNAGATYQHLMDKEFKGQLGRNLEVYADDMMVKSNDLETHIVDLEEVFSQLKKYNMRLSLEKC